MGPPKGTDPEIDTFNNYILHNMSREPPTSKQSSNLTHQERKALTELISNEDIIIKPADKGGSIVILNKDDYIKEAERQLNNLQHYKPLPYDTTLTNTGQIRKVLKRLEEMGKLPPNSTSQLIPKNIRTSPFYLLPKIHKPGCPGRPIVSGINCPTDIISRTMDNILKPTLKHIPSIIKDTREFLNIIKDEYLHEDEFLVTIDVSSLYTSIPHEEGLESVHKVLTTFPSPHMDADTAKLLTGMTLKNNTFKFNDKPYLQIQGTAMGTKVAPTYANIFMHYIETSMMDQSDITPRIWRRYINDIFAIYRCSEDELISHLQHLNTLHHSIKFTYEYSQQEINFLDTTVYIDSDRKLQTRLYNKPTDSHMYLHYNSCHPAHQKKSIAYSQAIRIRMICSEDPEYRKSSQLLIKHLTLRGHPHRQVRDSIIRAGQVDRDSLLTTRTNVNKQIIPFIIEYNPSNLRAAKYTKEALDFFTHKPCNQKFHKNKILVAYKRAANLRDILTSSPFPKPPRKQGSRPCMRFSCNQCNNIVTTTEVTSSFNNKKFKIIGDNTCLSRNVVYMITCPLCSDQYIGETGRTLAERLQNHKYNIRYRCRDLPVSAHFLDHDLQEKDLLCTILDNSASDKNVRLRLEEAWIRVMDTMKPRGMNLKLEMSSARQGQGQIPTGITGQPPL